MTCHAAGSRFQPAADYWSQNCSCPLVPEPAGSRAPALEQQRLVLPRNPKATLSIVSLKWLAVKSCSRYPAWRPQIAQDPAERFALGTHPIHRRPHSRRPGPPSAGPLDHCILPLIIHFNQAPLPADRSVSGDLLPEGSHRADRMRRLDCCLLSERASFMKQRRHPQALRKGPQAAARFAACGAAAACRGLG